MTPEQIQLYRRNLCKRMADGITEDGMKALQEWAAAKRASSFNVLEIEEDDQKCARERGRLSAFKEVGNLDSEISRLLSE